MSSATELPDAQNDELDDDSINELDDSVEESAAEDSDDSPGDDADESWDGSDADDDHIGGSGDDDLVAGLGDDRLDGDDGDDDLFGEDGDDDLNGGQGNDDLIGGIGHDHLHGGAGIDNLHGDDGNDDLFGDDGNDFLDGGSGLDIAHYEANHDDLDFISTTDGYQIQGLTSGIDTLVNIERLQLADTNIALDLEGNAGITAKILGAVFGKESLSNATYAGIGLDLLDNDMGYEALMQLALDVALGANASHRAVVDLLYSNLVGQAPTNEQAAPFVESLDSGMTSAALGVFAADLEINTENINLTGLAETGLEYIPFTG